MHDIPITGSVEHNLYTNALQLVFDILDRARETHVVTLN